MNKPIFKGSGVAIVTPMDSNLKINFETFEKLLDFHVKNGTDSIIVCGTTGEASTLTDDEQIEAIRFAVAKVNKAVPVIAGAGSNNTEHCIHLCKESQKAGADGLLLVTPYYNKATQKGLIAHYSAAASAVDLPIILYNVPSRTTLNIHPKTAYELSKIEHIVAIKEACGDISQIAELAHLVNGRMDIYSGNDDQIVPILSLGGIGVISVLANIAPKDVHDMVINFLDKKIEEATALQLKTMPLIKALFSEVNPIPVKAALGLMGYDVGGHRLPMTAMEENNKETLKSVMKEYGLI